MDKFFHSVYLNEDLCKGCINCIKRCPTEAIRVRKGKAVITNQFCIDCGECVRICSHHAKLIRYDHIDVLKNYEYTVALPAPSFYSQFNNLQDINIVLTALLDLGFDDVFEVSAAAELVSAAARKYIEENPDKWPVVSTACPSVVRLIRVRFPNLIDHLLPILPPVEVAAMLARQRAIDKTGLSGEQIGIIFISPCPSKVTYAKSPLGVEKSQIDNVLAIKEVYKDILPLMKKAKGAPKDLSTSGKIGIGWGGSGGEAAGLITDSYLAADGIENVIRVLEDLEDEKFSNLKFIELNACNGGCVGGVLTVENPYVAKVKLKEQGKYLPVSLNHLEHDDGESGQQYYWSDPVKYEPVYQLGDNMLENIAMLNRIEALCEKFPGLDCGSCGAPTCKALAEDIVRGKSVESDCIHILRHHIYELSDNAMNLANNSMTEDVTSDDYIQILRDYIGQLSQELSHLKSAQMPDGNTDEKDD